MAGPQLYLNFLKFSLTIIIFFLTPVYLYTKFTNVKCEDHDIKFSHFQTCNLKVVRRGVVALNVHVNLFQTPVTNSTVNIAVFKRANGYRPFLWNITEDICLFFGRRNRYPVLKFIMNFFLKYSNLNHSCPYTEDIIVKNLIFDEANFQVAPFPGGQYLLKGKVFAYNDLKATFSLYFHVTE